MHKVNKEHGNILTRRDPAEAKAGRVSAVPRQDIYVQYAQSHSIPLISRETFTMDTANRGYVTTPQLSEKLFTRN